MVGENIVFVIFCLVEYVMIISLVVCYDEFVLCVMYKVFLYCNDWVILRRDVVLIDFVIFYYKF